MAKYVIIDVDGVLNPTDMIDPESHGYKQFRSGYINMWLKFPLIKTIFAELVKRAQVLWGSTWGDDANIITRQVGFPDFPSIPIDYSGTDESWKIKSYESFLHSINFNARRDNVVILDDELFEDAILWGRNNNITVIPIDPTVGITLKDLNNRILPALNKNPSQ